MAVFNIYGCCICRDLFGFVPYNTHEVKHFMQSSSPIINFIYPEKPVKPMTEEDLKNVPCPDFRKKCIMNDYNKTVLDCFVEKSDFFVTDLIDIANTNLAKITDENGNEHYFTHSKWFRDAYNGALKDFFEDKTVTPLHRLKIIEKIGLESIIDKYVQWLLEEKQYKQEQIIMIENKRTPYYFDGEKMCLFEPFLRDKSNKLIEKATRLFKEKCPDCHIIRMPYSVYSVIDHPWGLTDLHFCYEYYEYLYKCVDLIANGDAEDKIEDLFYDYSNLLIKKNIAEYTNEQLLKGNFIPDVSDCYIAKKDSVIYSDSKGTKTSKKLDHYALVNEFSMPYSKIFGGYVNADACVKGVYGNGKFFGDKAWQTVNSNTCAVLKSNSVILCHNGSPSKNHMNIIQTVQNSDELCGKTVTLSVWARVIELSEEKKGGVIALINDNSYNKGQFYAMTEFGNKTWKRIVLTAKLPEKEDYKGLTVCFRACGVSGLKKKCAVVEFCNPKLEIGDTSAQ